jgi:CHAD domain-containing protein
MRVAIRRLRSALQNFEGTREAPLLSSSLRREFATQRKTLNKLGDALGRVRDFDVLDDYLREYAKHKLGKKVTQSSGLAAFERYLQNERADAFAPMVKKINRGREEGKSREQLARWALSLPAAAAPTLTLHEAAHQILPQRLAEVAFYAEVLEDPANIEGHHELRKSLKRLRYSLEFFAPCWNEPVKPFLKTLALLQDQLGEMNDRAVLREVAEEAFHLDAPVEGEAESSTHIPPPADLVQFLKHGEHRKRYLLGRVRTLWKAQVDAGFFDKLAAL